MSSVALALIFFALGWFVFRSWTLTRFLALKEQGHPQYFAAALAAAIVFLMSASLHAGFKQAFPELCVTLDGHFSQLLPSPASKNDDADSLRALGVITVWGFFTAWLATLLLNLPLHKNETIKRAFLKKQGLYDTIDETVEMAFTHARRLALLITMDSGKCYVGKPLSANLANNEREWLTLFPMISGYRDEKLDFKPTVFYTVFYEEVLKALDNDANRAKKITDMFAIQLPVSSIVSIHTFSMDIYAGHFNGTGQSTKPSTPYLAHLEAALETSPHRNSSTIGDEEATALSLYYLFAVLLVASFALLAQPILYITMLIMILTGGVGAICARDAHAASERTRLKKNASV